MYGALTNQLLFFSVIFVIMYVCMYLNDTCCYLELSLLGNEIQFADFGILKIINL